MIVPAKINSNIRQNSIVNSKREKKANRHKNLPPDLIEAINDSRSGKNLHGPFKSAEEAVASMLED